MLKWLLFFLALLLLVDGAWYLRRPHQDLSSCESLQIVTPKKGAKINSPLEIKVIVDNTKKACRWTVFEGQAGTVQLQDSNYNILGSSTLTTKDNWTEQTPTTFTATINFVKTITKDATLIINEENPSGKPGSKKVSLPLIQN